MDWLTLHAESVGFWAAFLTTVGFVPQVIRSWRVGSGESWMMLALFGAGIGMWFLYGYLLHSGPLMFANGLTGLQVVMLLILKAWRVWRPLPGTLVRAAARKLRQAPEPSQSS